jgi:hypothetical protein
MQRKAATDHCAGAAQNSPQMTCDFFSIAGSRLGVAKKREKTARKLIASVEKVLILR